MTKKEKTHGGRKREINKMERKSAKQGLRLEERITGGWGWGVGETKTENHHQTGKHFQGRHKAIKALMVFLIKII